MKKMYDMTVRGYYVMSVVLGILLALSVALAMEVAVMDAVLTASSESMVDALDKAWTYLPLGVTDVFYGTPWQAVLMVTTAIMTVGIFVRMFGTKGSRTKMLQAIATAILALLLMAAYRWAFHSWISNGVLALVPVILMVIPLTILRKTQQPVAKDVLTLWQELHNLWIGPRLRAFVKKHHWAFYVITVVTISVLLIFGPAIVRSFFG